MNDNEKQFLIELRELTLKHGIAIGGCGCCGSPYLRGLGKEERCKEAGYAPTSDDKTEAICWISPEDKFDWEKYSEFVVR